MQRKPVQSSNIKSVGYDKEKKTLEIEFSSGAIYQYHEIGERLHDSLIHAMSIGKFFSLHIKDDYPITKIS